VEATEELLKRSIKNLKQGVIRLTTKDKNEDRKPKNF
jgi:hypothetical protein